MSAAAASGVVLRVGGEMEDDCYNGLRGICHVLPFAVEPFKRLAWGEPISRLFPAKSIIFFFSSLLMNNIPRFAAQARV